jgi:hypothetical protein
MGTGKLFLMSCLFILSYGWEKGDFLSCISLLFPTQSDISASYLCACYPLQEGFLLRLIFPPWRWRRHVPSKCPLIITDYMALYTTTLYMESSCRAISEIWIGQDVVGRNRVLIVVPNHAMRGLGETMKILNHDSRCRGRDLNWAPPENENKELPLWWWSWQKRMIHGQYKRSNPLRSATL